MTHREEEIKLTGNLCDKGEGYAIEEIRNPKRMLPTTMKPRNGWLERISVVTSEPIPKNKIFECMDIINQETVEAPITRGAVLIENIADTGVDIIATRSMKLIK